MIPRLAWTKPPADRSAAAKALSEVIDQGTDELKFIAAQDLGRLTNQAEDKILAALAATGSSELKANFMKIIGRPWCRQKTVMAIAQYLESYDPRLRAAAADALKSCPEAFQTGRVERAISREEKEDVREEMQAALDRWRESGRGGVSWRPDQWTQ